MSPRNGASGGSEHGDTDHCPNCRKTGSHDISAHESFSEYDTWQCHNENCRVARYYVEPGTDGGERDV